MKGNVAIIVPPGTSTLMPSYLNTLEKGWIHPGVVVLLLEKGSKNGYRKVMCQGSIFEIREDSFYCLEREERESDGSKEF